MTTGLTFITLFNFILILFIGYTCYELGKTRATKKYYDLVIKKTFEKENTKVEKRTHNNK